MDETADTLLTRAQALAAQGQWDRAAAMYRRCLELSPAHAEAANGLGAALCMLGRAEEALAFFRAALDGDPAMAKAAANLGGALQSLGRWEEAADSLERAAARLPGHPQLWFNLGHAQHHLGRFGQAAASYGSAARLAPAYREAWTNLSVSFRELGRLDDALAAVDKALALAPDHAVSHYNRAFILLEKGDFRRGWEEHEWRFRAGIATPYPSSAPPWRGEPIPGRTLLVWAEQGFGDTLQFIRFLPQLAVDGARVILAVQPPLVRLLQGMAGAERVIALETPYPHDRHAPLMSLPYLLELDGTQISAPPYIRPPATARTPGPVPRVGLVWAGSPGHKNDRRRSLKPDQAARLSTLPGFDWISLQMGEADHPPGLAPPPSGIADFHDTAAIVQTLDLVISVDTAIAHLAGAMGVPVWLMLPFAPDWRWLHGRDDTPWYAHTRLFRQTAPGDWDAVTERVARALADVPPHGHRPM